VPNRAKLRFAEPYTVAVEHDRDRILDDGVGHEYVTTSPVGKIPAPAVAGPASCAGRYRWGRQLVIGGVDAGSSAAEVLLTAGPDLVSVEGARVVHDRPPVAPVAGAWLRCPPAGGPREIRQLEVDLDADQAIWTPTRWRSSRPRARSTPRCGLDQSGLFGITGLRVPVVAPEGRKVRSVGGCGAGRVSPGSADGASAPPAAAGGRSRT
jgi:hypothetical protein